MNEKELFRITTALLGCAVLISAILIALVNSNNERESEEIRRHEMYKILKEPIKE